MIAPQALSPVDGGPSTLIQVFRDRVAATPGGLAAQFKHEGAWKNVTWREISTRAQRVSNALLAAGVKRGDRVCLMGDTRLEWIVADLGIQGSGAVTVPIYQSNREDECQYIAENSGAAYVFVDTPAQAAKFARVKAELPGVKGVIQYVGAVAESVGGWIQPLESLGASADAFAVAHPEALDQVAATLTPGDLSTIIYTSGTTGRPKGVMLTHDSFAFTAGAAEEIGLVGTSDVQLLFLPLAHSFAQVIKGIWIKTGHVVAFAESIEKLMDNMGEVRPTVMASVPRIFEKAYNNVVTAGGAAPGVRGRLFRAFMADFEKYSKARDEKKEFQSLALTAGKLLVLPTIKEKLSQRFGGRLRFFFSGGAPLSRKIAYFFELTGIQILEGFGLTETCAATCINRPGHVKIGTVGPPLPGMEIKIASDGEVLIRGRGVMKGYFNNPTATAESIRPDGWFLSGDIGELDSDGFLRITDRKKDIIVTAGGKNVAPQNLENALKSHSIISQVVVHGDRRKFLSALITVSDERARKIAVDHGITFTNYSELSQAPQIRSEVQTAVDALNATLPSYETIKKFAVLNRDFTQEDGELTPTMKVKRKVCNERYKSVLDGMYGADVD